MGLKEKLTSIKQIVQGMENKVTEERVYRLHFLQFYNNKHINFNFIKDYIDMPLNCFKLPNDMSEEEAFLIISYIKEQVERELGIQSDTQNEAIMMNSLLEDYNFKKICNFNQTYKEKDITDLYIVGGNKKRFETSKHYEKHVEWFTPNVSEEQVQRIYKKHNINKRTLELRSKGK